MDEVEVNALYSEMCYQKKRKQKLINSDIFCAYGNKQIRKKKNKKQKKNKKKKK